MGEKGIGTNGEKGDGINEDWVISGGNGIGTNEVWLISSGKTGLKPTRFG